MVVHLKENTDESPIRQLLNILPDMLQNNHLTGTRQLQICVQRALCQQTIRSQPRKKIGNIHKEKASLLGSPLPEELLDPKK